MNKETNKLLIFICIFLISSSVILIFSLSSKNKFTLILSPDNSEEKFISLINSANDSIYVENYYFTNERIAFSLVAAKNRGVKVYVLIEDNEGVDKIYNLLRENGIDVKIDKRNITIHSKFMVIDKKIAIIGSHNLTKYAMERNREVSIVIESEEIAKKLIEIFENDYNLT